ncbi:MAG: hypothetical protein M3Z24_09335, partial [Chloroflexota bacterium]|nr:hypothetical protein [Chloroflexota bacterium]
MFRRFYSSTHQEISSRKTSSHTHIRTFASVVVAVFAVVFVMWSANSPAFAAGTPSSVDHRPLLKVVPKQVGIPGDGINCTGPHSGAYTWVCHVTLTELKSSDQPLHWFTRSDRPAKFSPANGNLSPGQSVQVV